MSVLPQAVVVCGGAGTRLASVLDGLPKALVPVAGRPLIAHLLDDLARAGVTEVLLLAGVGGAQLEQAAADLAPAGVTVQTVVEDRPLGTAGALQGAANRLRDRFLYLLGDVYTAVDWPRFVEAAEGNGGLGTLLLHRSSHPEDSDCVATDDADRLVGWLGRGDERRSSAVLPVAGLTNAGIALLDRGLLRYVPRERPCDLFGEVIPRRVDARDELYGYRSSEYVKDLGTPERLAAVDRDVGQGRARLRAELVLLDRDGVINAEVGPVFRADQLELLPGSAEGIKRLNDRGLRVAVVTNQAVVARGLCSAAELEGVHQRLVELLAVEGARLDGLYVCPHHPETHHAQGDPTLRGPCGCRKPAVGLVEQALAEQGVEPWRAVVVGDATVDLQLAANAGLASIGVRSGRACADTLHPARPVWLFDDLDAAARWLVGP